MLKRTLWLFSILLTAFSGMVDAQANDPNLGIIPAPVSLKKNAGVFVLSQQTTIIADSLTNKSALFLADYLQNTVMLRVQLKANDGKSAVNSIILTSLGTDNLPPEGYRLTITPQQILVAGKGAGLFYGIQTLIQLIPANRTATANLPCVQITDYPRFAYRGMMLDVCRHFFSVEFIKKYLDLMAAYKLNNFHWHLTDDQGWRIEIKKYPRLTQIGSQRAETVIGNYRDRTPQQYDNTPYGGFYTQDQIRDVVKYAANRYINVVPEIEMPGHSEAALAAYPIFSCDPSKTYSVVGTWGVFHDIYCPSDTTFGFLKDVLTEVMDLFPSKYIHIGGDEAPKDAWKKSEFCQKLMRELGLKTEDELQSYFIQRMEKFVNSKGRSIIGWDEILEGGLSPNATVMSWRGEEGGIAAAQQNHNVIMTPGSGGMYIDQQQSKQEQEPLSIGGYDPLSKVYSYDPIPDVLTPDQQKYVIGVQANLWTEYIPTENKVEYMILPRMLALSEIAWTPLDHKNFNDFANTRLPGHLAKLDAAGFDYKVPTAIGVQDTIVFGSQLKVNLKPSVTGSKVYYTLDNYDPRETDIEYSAPMVYTVPPDQYRDLKAVVITPSGKKSVVVHERMYNKTPLPGVSFTATARGMKYVLLSGDFKSVDQLAKAPAIDSGVTQTLSTAAFKNNIKGFGVIYTGYIHADTDGDYAFSTISANGSQLFVDNQLVVDNDGRHSVFEQGGSVPLLKGYHKITIKYFDNGNTGVVRTLITTPGKPKGEITASDMLYN